MTDDSLRPTAGARFLLERGEVAEDRRSARYVAKILTPEAVFAFDAELVAGEEPVLRARGETGAAGAAGQALVDGLTMLARLTARSVDKKLADGLQPWPDRILRWLGPGRGG